MRSKTVLTVKGGCISVIIREVLPEDRRWKDVRKTDTVQTAKCASLNTVSVFKLTH